MLSFAGLSIARLADPALALLLALGAGLFAWGRATGRPVSRAARAGRIAAWAGWGALWIASSPFAAIALSAALEPPPSALDEALASCDPARAALVVLSGGHRADDPAIPPSERLSAATQARVIGAARIQRAAGFAAVVVSAEGEATAEGMRELLVLLGVPRERVHLEHASTDTRTNAENSARLVRALGLERAVVVTSAVHVPRALAELRRAGLPAAGAPVDYVGRRGPLSASTLLPSSSALFRTHAALHELLGRLEP